MFVIRYLLGQGWQLANPAVLAGEVWQALAGRHLAGPAAIEAVYNQVWLHYAALLHGHCRQDTPVAWAELSRWLQQQAHSYHPNDREPLVQETILNLQRRLRAGPLDTPRAFLGYALTALRHRHIDLHRRRTAARRRQDRQLPLADLETGRPEQELVNWEDVNTAGSGRETEEAVADQQARHQLRAFFRAHLASAWQRRVAELHYLEDLSPAEIAPLLGKRPHEVRLIKARLVQNLRDLPPSAQQELQAILSGFD
jgi:RNA polymerase sigma factor (sigma-70 family)